MLAYDLRGTMGNFGIGFCLQPGMFYGVLFVGFVIGESLIDGPSPRRSYG